MIRRALRAYRQRREAAALLDRLRSASEGFATAELVEIWRSSRSKTMLKIARGSETFMALFFHRGAPDEVAENVFFAHENLAARLATDPRYRVPAPVEVVPALGCVITDFIDAPDLQSLLAHGVAPGSIERAGGWLSALHGAFPARPGTFDAAALVTPAPAHAPAPIRALGEALARMAADAGSPRTSLVKFHKDFAPRNVLIGAECVWAVDLTNTRWRMPEEDIAHFLLEAALDIGEGPARDGMGLPTELLPAFAAGYGLRAPDLAHIRPHLAALTLRQWSEAAGADTRTARLRKPLLEAIAAGISD